MSSNEAIQAKPNPLVEKLKKVPGLSIPLPSKGYFYRDGEVDPAVIASGEVHVHPMSARDEIIIRSPDLILNGEAIAKVVARCVPEVKDPFRLCYPDVLAIMIALRIATYGEDFPIKVDNPHYDKELQGSQKVLEFSVNLKNVLRGSVRVEDTSSSVVFINEDDDECKQKVVICPIRYQTIVNAAQEAIENPPYIPGRTKEPEEEAEDLLQMKMNIARLKQIRSTLDLAQTALLDMIYEVDGVRDREQIEEWYESVPAGEFDKVTKKIESITTLGPNVQIEIPDPISNKTFPATLPLNPSDFFGRSPATVKSSA